VTEISNSFATGNVQSPDDKDKWLLPSHDQALSRVPLVNAFVSISKFPNSTNALVFIFLQW